MRHAQAPKAEKTFHPAAGRDWLLPFYDPFVKLLGGDSARHKLIEQADIRAGQRVLDVGCGTGTMVTAIKRLRPEARVIGLDPDPKALARGKRKADRAGLSIGFERGFASALPFGEGSFDRVLSSYMFHHLSLAGRKQMLVEVRRVLAPGGSFHLLDFVEPEGNSGGISGHLFGHHLLGNTRAQIVSLMSEANLGSPRETGRQALLIGPMAYFMAYA